MRNKSNKNNWTQGIGWLGWFFLVFGIAFGANAIWPPFVTSLPGTTAEDLFIFKLVFGIVFGIIGLAGIIAGVVLLVKQPKTALRDKLRQEGLALQAEVMDCNPVPYVRSGYRAMFSLTARWKDASGRGYVFRSGLLRDDPRPYMRDAKTVTVLCDKDDYSRYYIDIEASIDPNIVGV